VTRIRRVRPDDRDALAGICVRTGAAGADATGGVLVGRFCDALRLAGVGGVHLVADAQNSGALAFYDRVDFTRLRSAPGEQGFGRAPG
jgi:hypothetical protein